MLSRNVTTSAYGKRDNDFKSKKPTASVERSSLQSTLKLTKEKSVSSYVKIPSRGSCYNCGSYNHRFKFCPKPWKAKFCFKCGLKDVITEYCPNCKGLYSRKKPLQVASASKSQYQDRRGDTATENSSLDIHEKSLESLFKFKEDAQTSDLWHFNDIVTDWSDDFSNKPDTIFSTEAIISDESDPVQDFLLLIDAVKHLSVNSQELILMYVINERKAIMEQKKTK